MLGRGLFDGVATHVAWVSMAQDAVACVDNPNCACEPLDLMPTLPKAWAEYEVVGSHASDEGEAVLAAADTLAEGCEPRRCENQRIILMALERITRTSHHYRSEIGAAQRILDWVVRATQLEDIVWIQAAFVLANIAQDSGANAPLLAHPSATAGVLLLLTRTEIAAYQERALRVIEPLSCNDPYRASVIAETVTPDHLLWAARRGTSRHTIPQHIIAALRVLVLALRSEHSGAVSSQFMRQLEDMEEYEGLRVQVMEAAAAKGVLPDAPVQGWVVKHW